MAEKEAKKQVKDAAAKEEKPKAAAKTTKADETKPAEKKADTTKADTTKAATTKADKEVKKNNAKEEAPVKKVKKSKNKRTVTEGKVYIQSSFNNTIVTFTDNKGNTLSWSSAGANGFKGAKKATPYAAQISAEAAANKALLYGLEKVDVFVKGIGAGRDQAIRGINGAGISIETITDITPIPHNGCRPRKSRRV